MPCLLDLSLELLEMVALQLESVEDVISLGSSCALLARVVGQQRIWKVLLANSENEYGDRAMTRTSLVDDRTGVMEDRMRAIATFLSSLEDRDAIFSLLHQTIYQCYPGTSEEEEDGGRWELEYDDDVIRVSLPPTPRLHSVSSLGLELTLGQNGLGVSCPAFG